jgi:hypothetical protein
MKHADDYPNKLLDEQLEAVVYLAELDGKPGLVDVVSKKVSEIREYLKD